jgi:hypothetical protein
VIDSRVLKKRRVHSAFECWHSKTDGLYLLLVTSAGIGAAILLADRWKQMVFTPCDMIALDEGADIVREYGTPENGLEAQKMPVFGFSGEKQTLRMPQDRS